MNTSILCAIRRAVRAAPMAAVLATTGVFCPVALGDPGDLVADFGDAGRFVPPDGFHGAAQFVELQDVGAVFGGGEDEEYSYYTAGVYIDGLGGTPGSWHTGHRAHGFAGRLIDGTLDPEFDAAGLADIEVIDAQTQADRKIVGIGRRGADVYLVFRLEPDGALDAGFGEAGIRVLSDVEGLGSIAADPGGTIVVAGWLGSDLKVLRLLPSGDLDATFGTAGVFTAATDGSEASGWAPPHVLSAQDGGYRVTINDDVSSGVSRCRVLALTASGAVDGSFGEGGYAGLSAPDGSITCKSISELADGRLLVAGSAGDEPLMVRLIASGASDATFAADDLAGTTMTGASAVAVDPDTGSIAVAGPAPDNVTGFLVARLQPEGSLDRQFGTAGAAWVDIGGRTTPSDVTFLPGGDVLVVGGPDAPFVARLDGNGGEGSPGVLGVKYFDVDATERAHQAVVTVRRTGGKSGNVSVAYTTHDVLGYGIGRATEGRDYTATSGRLEWADGDASDKQIVVPIAAGDGAPEESEMFKLTLSDAQGGAGLGTATTDVHIAANDSSGGGGGRTGLLSLLLLAVADWTRGRRRAGGAIRVPGRRMLDT